MFWLVSALLRKHFFTTASWLKSHLWIANYHLGCRPGRSGLFFMASPINILYLCNSPAVMAGVEKTVLLLLEGMNRSKFTPRVILNGFGPFYDSLVASGQDVEVIESHSKVSAKFAINLRNSLRKRPADVVQLHLSRFYAPLIHICGAKVTERLNMTRHSSGFYLSRSPFIDRTTAKWVDRFIVVSDSLKAQFVERGYSSDKLQRVYNGITPQETTNPRKIRQELSLSEDQVLIGGVGRMTRQKAMDTVLRTFAIIAEQMPSARFALAGDGELRSDLKRLAGELKLHDRIEFLGFREDVLDVIASFDLMFYPSRWEPFANTILEAMAVGTPIVASNVGGNAEAITDGENGFLVPVDDPDKSAEVILDALNNRDRLKSITDTAQQCVKRYSVANMVTGHEMVYKGLL